MAQNSFVLDEINREATKVRADAHLQKSLPGKGIPLKTTQAFLKSLRNYIQLFQSLFARAHISSA